MPIFTKKLFAEDYVVSSSVVSMSIAQASGSTIFGDTADDTHLFVGNTISGSATSTASFGKYENIVSFAGADGTEPLFSGSAASTGSFGQLNIKQQKIYEKSNDLVLESTPNSDHIVFRTGDNDGAALDKNGSFIIGRGANVPATNHSGGNGSLTVYNNGTSLIKIANSTTGQDANSGTDLMGLSDEFLIINREAGDIRLKTNNNNFIFDGVANTWSGSSTSTGSFGHLLVGGSELASSPNATDGSQNTISGSAASTGSFGRVSSTTAKIGDAEVRTLDDGKYLFVGADVGTNVEGVTGDALIGFGYDVLSAKPGTARRNVAMGYDNQNVNTNGQYNTSMGWSALKSQGDGDYNTGLGYAALYSSTSASYSTAVGALSLATATTGNGNTAVGYAAAYTLPSSGTGIVALGSGAGQSNTGNNNTFVGYESFNGHNTNNTSNTIIGYRAMYGAGGYQHTGMSNNVAIGHEPAYRFHKGNNNTFIGGGAVAYYYVTGSENTVIGTGTASSLSTGPYDLGHENFIHGVSAGTALDGGQYNILIGRQSGQVLSTGDSNTFVGRQSGAGVTTGFDNVCIGYQSGLNADTNQDCVYVGKTTYGTSGAANEIVIGHEAVGRGSNTVVLGDDNITDIFLSEDKGAIVYGGTFSGSAFVDDGTQLNVPDYVFEPEYDLKSLEYVETHISQSKHLPGVPSREDKNGWVSYDMGGRDMLLLEKIEELTLYIIDLEKRIKVLEENK